MTWQTVYITNSEIAANEKLYYYHHIKQTEARAIHRDGKWLVQEKKR